MVNQVNNKYLFIAIVLIHFIIQWHHLNLDFWNDEIYSILNFSLTPINTTLGDYHSTNNHIFFNLLNNLYFKILLISSLKEIFENPFLIRFLPFIYSVFNLIFIFNIGEKIIKNAGIIACIILITSIPFFNFATQLRGYGLSMMLISGATYFGLKYLDSDNKKHLVLTSLFITFSIYTLTINLLFLVSIGSIVIIYWGLNRNDIILKRSLLTVLISLIISASIGIILYAPIFNQAFSDSFVESSNEQIPFNFSLINVVFLSFISKQYILILLSFLGSIFILKDYKINKNKIIILASLATTLVIPFILAIILSIAFGQRAFERIFINLILSYSLLLAVLITHFFNRIKINTIFTYLIIATISGITFYFQTIRIDEHLSKESIRGQGLYFNYYLAHFQPKKDIKFFLEREDYKQEKIYVVEGEQHGILNYLDIYNLNYEWQTDLTKIDFENSKTTYIISPFPNITIKDITGINPRLKCEIINPKITYNTFIKVILPN